ncbi:uncharacterized protein LOC124712214 [Schistocerca piceifrons]|uniref:uncharacterized protein LOC124712214 n=1 Tax=Schistocerca piceifrons TaxID=274613 RepID=UPI001F5F5756|nr:uncharacterized protein LOC124712214 [Schistocerca piceifrons]
MSNRDMEWILDSGASVHIVKDKSLLYDIKYKTQLGISAVDGNKLQCHLAGKLDLHVSVNGESDMVTAHNVHYVKNVATNLLSVGEIVRKGNTVTFDMQGARVISESGEVIAIASNERGIFKLDTIDSKHKNVIDSVYSAEGFLWHRRLGHLNRKSMSIIRIW